MSLLDPAAWLLYSSAIILAKQLSESIFKEGKLIHFKGDHGDRIFACSYI